MKCNNIKDVCFLRMRESHKRFVKTWIRFANPWIRTVSWPRILDSYGSVDHKSWLSKIRFQSLVTNPVNFQRFACFYESNESLQILCTIAQNESLKIEIRESEFLRILKYQIRESGFVGLFLKDSFCGFVLWKQKSQITRFVSIRKDSYTNPASLMFLRYWLGYEFAESITTSKNWMPCKAEKLKACGRWYYKLCLGCWGHWGHLMASNGQSCWNSLQIPDTWNPIPLTSGNRWSSHPLHLKKSCQKKSCQLIIIVV
jgi:hypothetical protein